MARMIPPILSNYEYDGEQEIGLKLQNDPETQDWIILHSLDIANHKSQITGECDFVILIPNKGVLCVEVKACKSLKVENGIWYYGVKAQGDKRGPFKQASNNMRSIQKHLFKKRPDLKKTVFWTAVIFPYLIFKKSSPEWHDWQLLDANDYLTKPVSYLFLNVLNHARDLLSKTSTAKWFNFHDCIPDINQCADIANILRPEFELFESPASRHNNLYSSLKHFTEEQFVALDAMQRTSRALFDGPAGTGKTLLAIEAARREISQEKNVLFVCYNKNIAEWIKLQFSEIDFHFLTLSTLHSLMLSTIKIKTPLKPTPDYWTSTLPEQAVTKLLDDQKQELTQWEVMIVDESQDILRSDYLDFLDLCLSGGISQGRWKMFGDFTYQHIYSTASIQLDDFIEKWCDNTPIYTLGINCRNTPRVAAYAPILGGLSPDYVKVLRADDYHKPELLFFSNAGEQLSILAQQLDRFRDRENYKGNNIVILSPISETCCALKLQPPWRDRIKPFNIKPAGGHVMFSTIHSFKGLEAPVIIVTDINNLNSRESRNLLYIAVTRSISRLILLINESVRKDLKILLGVD